jgi:hypothetical protein
MRAIFANISFGRNQINTLPNKTKTWIPMHNKECQKPLMCL